MSAVRFASVTSFVVILVGFAASTMANADDGDETMARVLAACPGAAKFILEGHLDQASPEAAKRAEGAARNASAPPTHPGLGAELLWMSGQDQAARQGDLNDPQVGKRMLAVDARNLPRIEKIIAEHGFPTVAMVGQDGFNAAWLLVQHADADPGFQQRTLEGLVATHQVGGEQLALLTDRVLRAQGKPQRYGSQFTAGDDGGQWIPQPIEGPVSEVDKRRASLGMMPLADYGCTINAMYRKPEH